VRNVSLNVLLLLNQSYAIRIDPLGLRIVGASHFNCCKFFDVKWNSIFRNFQNEGHIAM